MMKLISKKVLISTAVLVIGHVARKELERRFS